MEEDPTLATVFKRIFVLLNRREDVRKQIESLRLPSHNSTDLRLHDESKELVSDLRRVEFELLTAIVTLADAVESHSCGDNKSRSAAQLVRSCKLFALACDILQSHTDQSNEFCATLRKCDNSGSEGSIAQVIFATRHNTLFVPIFGLALDLLQYWELVLRNQTQIPCKEFCDGVRKSLFQRVQMLLRHDIVLRMIPNAANVSALTPLSEVFSKEVIDRLARVTVRLQQIDSLQDAFRSRAEKDFPSEMKRQRVLYGDELAVVLSELVHLSDNVRKLLIASIQDPNQLGFVEEITCYRVAACFVNTRKHGLRGRNKTSAVADYEIVAVAEGKIHALDLLINYKGDGWQASALIVDLLHLWELFIRYYTAADVTEFREHVGGRFAKMGQLGTYTCDLRDSVDEEMTRKANERLRYNI